MLNCILGMVDKTKRALAVLQERSLRDREELAVWMRRQAEGMDQDVKKHTNDMMAFTVRQTEDRVSEVRRRAGKDPGGWVGGWVGWLVGWLVGWFFQPSQPHRGYIRARGERKTKSEK